MAAERLSMKKIREILRLKLLLGRSNRETARILGVSAGKVSDTWVRAKARGVDWPAAEALSDEALDEKLFGPRHARRSGRPEPDLEWVHRELRKVGVTLELLHLEYLEQHPQGYRYSAFCHRYRAWLESKPVVMRQVHKAGERTFLDYSGKKPSIVERATGELREVELFVAVLGASSFTFAEATLTQQLPDWVSSNENAYHYFGGVTALQVSDQLRSAVRKPCRYEPLTTRTYDELAKHYHTALLPARPHKPRDKAKVEVAVLVAQRWILARLRNELFFSLESLNQRIAELLEQLNNRPMRHLGGVSRRELYERIDRPVLRPLPDTRFEYSEWSRKTANLDYHFELDRHYYSVPYQLARKELEIRATATTVEAFLVGKRVACHARSYEPYKHTTNPAHMPKAHQRQRDWQPSLLLAWAQQVGPMTEALVQRIIDSRPHPEQGYRSCKGLQRVGNKYGPERLEAACGRALLAGAYSYHPVDEILRRGLDRLGAEPADEAPAGPRIDHENVRGPDYYH